MKPDTTLVAARILGPLLVVAGVLLITQPHRMLTALGGFLLNDALLILGAFVSLVLGLALVTFHQRWDSFTAIIISLIGWLMTVRGVVLLLLPDAIHQIADIIVRQPAIMPIAGCVMALLGVWLAYTGYIAGVLRVDTSPPRRTA
jgi:hypothetical protein